MTAKNRRMQQCILPIEERMEMSSDPWIVLGLMQATFHPTINPETLAIIHKGLLHKHRDNGAAIEAINQAVNNITRG